MGDEDTGWDWQDDARGLAVLDGEFVTVTADGASHRGFQPVAALLRRLHRTLGLDVVFVCQMAGGKVLLRDAQAPAQAQAIRPEHADPLESDWAARVLRERCGEPRATCTSLPVVAKDGFDYGTVACRLADAAQPDVLYAVARLVALALSSHVTARRVDLWADSAAAPLGLGAPATALA